MRIDGPQITGSFNLNGDTVADLDIFTTTSSFNLMTASMATTASNIFIGTQTHSGSIVPSVNNTYDLGSPTHQFRHVYISTGSLYIDGTKVLGSTSSELQITTDVGQSFKILETGADTITLQSNDGNVTLTSTGGGDIVMDPSTGVIGLKGTVTIYTGNKITSSDGNVIQFGNGIAITGSIVATGTNLISGSSQVLNGSGVWSGSAQLPSSIVSSSAQVSSYGLATTGSNNFIGTQTITGSLYISQNLIVQGSSSLQDVTGSNVYIGTNKINLNTDTPSIRFGGISVFDSGSNFGESGSLLWDSQNNRWLYQHPASSGAPYKSAMLISGPKNSGSLGSEETLTSGKIMVAVGDDHIGNSIMSESGGGIGISGSLSITGSIVATGTSLWSGSAQLPSGVISGSAQVDVMSTTNIARLATTGSNVFSSNQVVTGSISSTGNISAGTTFNWNGGIGALSYGSGVVTLETNTANAIQLKTNGTTAITISTGQTVNFSSSVGVGYSSPAYQLQVLNTIGLRANSQNFQAIKGTGWGYSPGSYRVVMLGDSDPANFTTVSIGYDPSGNSNGAFNGNGTEVLFRNGASFATPTSGNTAFHLNTLVMKDGKVGINTGTPAGALDVQSAGANGIILSSDSNDANNSGRIFLMRTGGEGWAIMNNANNLSFRSNAIPGNTSGSERMRLDSSYNLILNNGLSVAGATNKTGALRMNNGTGGSSPRITFGTEDESVPGNKSIYLDTYWMILQPHVNEGLRVRFVNGSGTQTETVRFQSTQATFYTNLLPGSDAAYNLGSTSLRWNHVYTTDLHLSNEGKQNVVDGTWGDWTLQEGENDIYMLNNRSGEKFKIKLEKIV
jgi:hypothetical protein